MKIKACSQCKAELPHTAEFFRRRSRSPSGLSYRCKKCDAAYNKQYANKNRERIRRTVSEWYWNKGGKERQRASKAKWKGSPGHERYRKSRRYAAHGITSEHFNRMLQLQQGRCAICNLVPDVLCIDHDHKTGEIRGLLCRTCNSAIGKLHDSPDIVLNAHLYLLHPPARRVLTGELEAAASD